MSRETPLKFYQEPEGRWIGLLKEHWSKALIAIMVIITILVWSERLFGKKEVNSQQDYVLASQLFERFQRDEMIDLESLLATEDIINKHPELKASYETMLARCFFMQNDPAKGIAYATSALERNKHALPAPYSAFGHASLLIADSKFDEALVITEQLKAEEGSLLELFNLVRLAMLRKETSWERVRSHPRFDAIAPLFQEGAVSLEQLHPLPVVRNHPL